MDKKEFYVSIMKNEGYAKLPKMWIIMGPYSSVQVRFILSNLIFY